MQSMSEGLRDEVRALVDGLPEDELPAARRYLEYLRDLGDPVLRAALRAPLDDEPETAEEAAAVRAGSDEAAQGETLSTEKLRRELGL